MRLSRPRRDPTTGSARWNGACVTEWGSHHSGLSGNPGVERVAVLRVRSVPGCSKLVGDLDHRRAQEHDEQGWEDASDHREEHLQRGLLPQFLGALPALAADLLGLDAQDVGDTHAELLRLNYRLDEVAQLLDLAALADIVERLEAGPPEANLVEHDGQLSREFVVVLVDHPGQGGVKAQPGLDRDREQVERAREREQDLLLALLDTSRHNH